MITKTVALVFLIALCLALLASSPPTPALPVLVDMPMPDLC